jgi:hypothetical protein
MHSLRRMAMKPMTEKEFVGKFVQMLRNRLGGKPEPPDLPRLEQMDPPTWLGSNFRKVAAGLLKQIPAAGSGLGSCTYTVTVNGQDQVVCIHNVTPTECDGLAGDFNPANTCNNPPGPWPEGTGV